MQRQAEKKVRTNGWGIDLNYEDAMGEWHDTPQETIDALLRAMGAEPDALIPPVNHTVMVVRAGEQLEIPRAAIVTLEDGQSISVTGRLPADLPLGYHWLLFEGEAKPCRLIVGPAQCWMPDRLKTWGWAVQLYGARSRDSWGIGDLGDLEKLGGVVSGVRRSHALGEPVKRSHPLCHNNKRAPTIRVHGDS